MRNGTRARIARGGRWWAGVLALAVLPMGGCEDTGATASAAAVDHVASVLADAGRAPARLESAVRPECSPTDAFLGLHLTSDPLHVEVAHADVAAVVADLGTELPPAGEVDDDDLDRWEQEGTVTDAALYVCG